MVCLVLFALSSKKHNREKINGTVPVIKYRKTFYSIFIYFSPVFIVEEIYQTVEKHDHLVIQSTHCELYNLHVSLISFVKASLSLCTFNFIVRWWEEEEWEGGGGGGVGGRGQRMPCT